MMSSGGGLFIRFALLALLVGTIYGLQSDLLLPKYLKRTHDYSDAVNIFISSAENGYFELIIKVDEKNRKVFETINEHLTEVLKNATNYARTLSVNDLTNRKALKSIVFIDGYTSFLKLYPHLERHGENKAGIYLFVLFLEPGIDYYWIMKNIMRKMYERNLQKITILVRSVENIMELYAFHLYTKTHCGKVIPVRINRFINGRLEVPMKFPILRCQNLYQCTINVFSWNITPFMILGKEATVQKNTLNFSGFEGEILKIVAKKLNFSIKLFTNPTYIFDEVYSKENMTGSFAMLRDRTIDMSMGYVTYSKDRVSNFEFSQRYYLTNYVGILNRYRTFEDDLWLYEPFEVETWILLVICLIVVLLFMYKCTPQKDRAILWLPVLAQLLGVTIPIDSKIRKFYFLIPVLGICFLVLRSAYSGKIYVSFNIESSRKLPETVTDLILQNYSFHSVRSYTDAITGRFIPQNSSGSTLNEFFYKFEKEPSNKKVAALVAQARLIYYVMEKNRPDLFETIPQTLTKHNFCAYFTVGSCISNSFDNIISRLLSSGIIDKWVSQYKADLRSYEQFLRNALKFKKPVPLSLQKLSLIFMIFGIGLTIASLAFISEIFFGYTIYTKVWCLFLKFFSYLGTLFAALNFKIKNYFIAPQRHA